MTDTENLKPNNFVTFKQVCAAASIWYNSSDRDYLCLAENRLMKGEIPYDGFYEIIEIINRE